MLPGQSRPNDMRVGRVKDGTQEGLSDSDMPTRCADVGRSAGMGSLYLPRISIRCRDKDLLSKALCIVQHIIARSDAG